MASGEIGGRTAQIEATGEVTCATYDPAALKPGEVRIRTVTSAISPGTEMTYYGRNATNVYLNKTWNPDLRLFDEGAPTQSYPIVFGYRAAGVVSETRADEVEVGQRVYGNWRHTEFTTMSGGKAQAQLVPEHLSWDDAVDLGQMGPICVNAVAFGEGLEAGRPAAIYGAGPVGLITAQIVKAAGAFPVYVVDRIAERLAIASGLGMETILVEDVDVARELKTRHGADGLPVIWECSGSTVALHQAIRTVMRQGLVVAVGFYQAEALGLYLGDEFHHNGVRIVSGQIGNIHTGLDIASLRARTIDLVSSGALVLGALPRLRVAIDEVAVAFEALKRPDEVLQTALTFEPSGAASV